MQTGQSSTVAIVSFLLALVSISPAEAEGPLDMLDYRDFIRQCADSCQSPEILVEDTFEREMPDIVDVPGGFDAPNMGEPAGGGSGIAAESDKTESADEPKVCALGGSVPYPEDASPQENVAEVLGMVESEGVIAAGLQWYRSVKGMGRWDYGAHHGEKYSDAHNYNYALTGYVLWHEFFEHTGLPYSDNLIRHILELGSLAAQIEENTLKSPAPEPFFAEDPRDVPFLQSGFEDARVIMDWSPTAADIRSDIAKCE